MSAATEYSKVQDEILHVQANIMKGFSQKNVAEQAEKNENTEDYYTKDETVKISSENIISDTLNGVYSLKKESANIGLSRYPSLGHIYFTNKKLFKVDALSEEDVSHGLKYDEEYGASSTTPSVYAYNTAEFEVEDLTGVEVAGTINEETGEFSATETTRIESLPLITKPELVINSQISVYVSFDQVFLDLDYNLKEIFSNLVNVDPKESNMFDFGYYKQFKDPQTPLKVFKSGDLPIWGMKIFTDDSNPLGILRQSAIYKKLTDDQEQIVGCSLVGFELVNGVKKLDKPVNIYFDGRETIVEPVDFVLVFKYLPTLKNYYGNNAAFERNGVVSRNWYGSQFLSGHDGLSIALWDIEFTWCGFM